jgi:hypothetical protein
MLDPERVIPNAVGNLWLRGEKMPLRSGHAFGMTHYHRTPLDLPVDRFPRF